MSVSGKLLPVHLRVKLSNELISCPGFGVLKGSVAKGEAKFKKMFQTFLAGFTLIKIHKLISMNDLPVIRDSCMRKGFCDCQGANIASR